jgi:amino acid permease
MPHGFCLRWDPLLLLVFIVGNVGIAIAYFIIPAVLRHFIGQRKDLPYPHMFKLFAAFILSCGLTHLVKVWTIYQPVYWIEAGIDLWTALVSLITAFLLIPIIPRALKLRSPSELDRANERLQKCTAELEAAKETAERALETKSRFLPQSATKCAPLWLASSD